MLKEEEMKGKTKLKKNVEEAYAEGDHPSTCARFHPLLKEKGGSKTEKKKIREL